MLRVKAKTLTIGSLLALGGGFALGALSGVHGFGALGAVGQLLVPLGELWIHALRMLILPFIVSFLLLALADAPDGARSMRAGGLSLVCFVAILCLGLAFSLIVAPSLVRFVPTAPDGVAGAAGAAASAAAAGGGSVGDWTTRLIPPNPVAAAADDNILGVVVVTLLFGLAVARIAPAHRTLIVRLARAARDATLVLAGWVLTLMPIAVFGISFNLASLGGVATVRIVVGYILVTSAMLVVFTLFLYVIATTLGRVSIRRFAAAVVPAQIVAVGTRSSLASLPALVEGAETRLGLPESISGLVLPLSVAVFKANRTVTSPLNLFILAHIYGVPLSAATIALFAGTTLLLSFASPGIPSGGQFLMLPFYLAAGIPLEGVVLIKAADAIPDIFKTVANVTADMTVAVIAAARAGVRYADGAAGAVGAERVRTGRSAALS